jgi:hypothetical protein
MLLIQEKKNQNPTHKKPSALKIPFIIHAHILSGNITIQYSR